MAPQNSEEMGVAERNSRGRFLVIHVINCLLDLVVQKQLT